MIVFFGLGNIEKLQLVEAEKKKIRQEYERKEKQVDVRKKMYKFLLLLLLLFFFFFLRYKRNVV